jgi:hypothetical protein
MPDGEVPKVEQVMPLLGIALVPVTMGAGLTPGDAISVEPSGIPAGPTVEPVVMPSGEVAAIEGVGAAMAPICAIAALDMTSVGRTAAISKSPIDLADLQTAFAHRAPMSISLAAESRGVRLSDIGQSLIGGAMTLRRNQQRQMLSFLSSASSSVYCLASNAESLACSASLAGECG